MVQVLCCEVDAIFSTLLEDADLCGSLFTLLDQPRPLDCMLAGYFARVLVCLLMRRSRDLLRYLKVGHTRPFCASAFITVDVSTFPAVTRCVRALRSWPPGRNSRRCARNFR